MSRAKGSLRRRRVVGILEEEEEGDDDKNVVVKSRFKNFSFSIIR